MNSSVVHNTYVDRTVVNNTTNISNHVSFNGPGGINARPTAAEQAPANERHITATDGQRAHVEDARHDPSQRYSVNHGQPTRAAQSGTAEHHVNEQHAAEHPQGAQHAAEHHVTEQHKAEHHQGEQHKAEVHQGEQHKAEHHQGEQHAAQHHQGEQQHAAQHHQGEQHAVQHHQGEQHAKTEPRPSKSHGESKANEKKPKE